MARFSPHYEEERDEVSRHSPYAREGPPEGHAQVDPKTGGTDDGTAYRAVEEIGTGILADYGDATPDEAPWFVSATEFASYAM